MMKRQGIMTKNCCLLVACAGILLCAVDPAKAQFVPGHVFVADAPSNFCSHPEQGPDRIWEVDPETGQAWVFKEFEECVMVSGMTFTPDGSRLRVSATIANQILELDSDGKVTIALDSDDGVGGPMGSNNIAYDREGNFYVGNMSAAMWRYRVDGGPGTIIADFNDGLRGLSSIVFAADGVLYFAPGGDGPDLLSDDYILRFPPPNWKVSIFDESFPVFGVQSFLSADDTGHLYLGYSTKLYRYNANDPTSRVFLGDVGGRLTIAPDQTHLYVLRVVNGPSVVSVDVTDGTFSVVAPLSDGDIQLGFWRGIAVVPVLTLDGDFDFDGDVDLEDVERFYECFSGIGSNLLDFGCGPGDFDRDVDIDLADFGQLQLALTMP